MAASGSADKTIFVSIPSYRDPECQYTIVDLFQKAKHPKRVRVGVCWQVNRAEDSQCFLLDLEHLRQSGQLRESEMHHSKARGPCIARANIERELLDGEDFVFQLDSHYRMAQDWDEELILQLSRCPSERAILTTYPSSYTLPDDYKAGGPDTARLHSGIDPVLLCAREFGASDGFIRIAGKPCSQASIGATPSPALFWAAGFVFAPSAAVREVPYDPHLEDLFFGEESAMAARLWTSGWDFYSPTKVIGYHLWTRKHRPVFREHAGEAQEQREKNSQLRVRSLLAVDGDASMDLGA